jgi:mannosyltransferase OCH1-like enzyme
MIPKIIYYVWLGDEMPQEYKEYVKGWKRIMPDYEIVRVAEDNIITTNVMTRALNEKRYAQVANYLRLRRIYFTGGIYLDTDVEVIKPFDLFLKDRFFAGCQGGDPPIINNGVFGAVAGHPLIKSALDVIAAMPDLPPFKSGPELFTEVAKTFGWAEEDRTQHIEKGKIYDSRYFYPYYFTEKYDPGCITKSTYALHHWAGSWLK